jgi:hypothetical protein
MDESDKRSSHREGNDRGKDMRTKEQGAKNAELTGSVTDTGGAVIANAQVTIAYIGPGESHTVTGNARAFTFFPLNRGVYTLKVEAGGFLRSVLAAEL